MLVLVIKENTWVMVGETKIYFRGVVGDEDRSSNRPPRSIKLAFDAPMEVEIVRENAKQKTRRDRDHHDNLSGQK